MAAAPGILLKAFSLFPAICSVPPGPGHVDNLFVEGKGAKSEKRGKCHYLLRQFLQPKLGCWAALVGKHHTHSGFPISWGPSSRGGEQGSTEVQLDGHSRGWS